jgi:hypothetical protein
MVEPREQGTAVEHDRGICGKHHVGQPRNAGHDLKPCAGSDERCRERPEAAPGGSQVTRRILRPGARLHPRVDCVSHLEMRGIGQQ